MDMLKGVYWIAIDQALFGTLISFPIISIGLLVFLVFGAREAYKQSPIFPDRFFLYVGAATVFPFIIALLGTIYFDTQDYFVSYVQLGLLGLLLVLTAYVIYREKGRRITASSLGACFLLWTFWATFVASMSVFNDWL
jgi:hypothetical protein